MSSDSNTTVPTDPQSTVSKKKTTSKTWILINSSGQSTVLDFDKYDIMERVHINARDLRILDPLLSYPSTVLVRGTAIVLNLDHIKAVITADEVLIRDPFDENVVTVVEEFKRRLQPVDCLRQQNDNDIETIEEDEEEEEFPFEFRALEVALEAICSFLAARTTELETAAYPTLDELTSKVSSGNLDRVRKLKSTMTRLTARVQKVRDELEQLLNDDDDMNDLYLTRKLTVSSPISASGQALWSHSSPTHGSKISRPCKANASKASVATAKGDETNVEDLEMLLEAYFMQIDATYNKLTTLRQYIDDTEDYINIRLDNKRNKLIQLELCVSAATMCISIYSLIAGIFGMNIPYTWNDNNSDKFTWVVCVSGVSCLLLFIMIIKYALRKGLLGS